MQQEKQQRENMEFPGREDDQTGHDLPDSDGTVSDEDTRDIDGFSRPDQKPTGQDHSADEERGTGDE